MSQLHRGQRNVGSGADAPDDGLDGFGRELAELAGVAGCRNRLIRVHVQVAESHGRDTGEGVDLGLEAAQWREETFRLRLGEQDRSLDHDQVAPPERTGHNRGAYIAMVLAQDTRYVMLDEPLNNLDMVHATGVMRLLRSLADEHGKSIVLVLHDINYASIYSDRIIAMRDGLVVSDGPPADVITPAVLEEVFGVPFPVHDLAGDRIAAYFR